MGLVQRQSLRNTLISYVGLIIGFVNTTIILPRLLSSSQLGLTTTLVAIATLGAQLAAFGLASTTIRYFPYFRNQGRAHAGFLPLLLTLPLLGFGVVASVLWLGKPLILQLYHRDTALLAPHYGVVFGLAGVMLLYALFDAFLRALFRSAFSSFLMEVVIRLLIVAAAAAYWQGYLNFSGFVLAYAGSYAVVALLLLVYVAAIGELNLRPQRHSLRIKPLRELVGFGAFALLSNISGTVLLTIDNLMVGAKLSLAAAGVYAIATNISTALTLPFRALNKTAFPLIAEYWKDGAMDKMADFYRRSTRVGTIVGCYLALGIGLNLDFIYGLIHRPEYATATTAVLLLLLGRLIDGITGVNGSIVLTSPRYRYDLIFNLSLSASIVGLNWLLIPRYGLTGAALAYCVAISSINLIRTAFVWYVYGLQPFDRRIGLILLVAAVAGAVAWALPTLPNSWLTLLLRGSTLTIIFGLGLLLTRTAPELNNLITRVRQLIKH
ncbi:oligosaccharide flippase family protein [Hymenobacter sp. ASUV-10]|uniref:Oligosaccharide flippase family protein n=1 Tax=Hymenobacter aranciens TaxID=3063996 RepID=A0ABT9BDU4_9BACT|nr:oligosaccharide flippase family protein [Hymenobacter sp. ASUV-10]MDO7876438.1 oligosaccharide flippase family protein [Hymenobacter sp. ASUV-10]